MPCYKKENRAQAGVERDLKMSTHLRSKKLCGIFHPSKLLLPSFRTFFVSEFASRNAAGGKKRVSLIKLYTNTQSFLLNQLRAIVTLSILVPNASNRCLQMALAPNHASALYRDYLKTRIFLQNYFYSLPKQRKIKMGYFQLNLMFYLVFHGKM